MLQQFLNYQIKSKVFLIPASLLLFAFYSILTGIDMSTLVLFFLQGFFYDVIRKNSLNLPLIRVTAFPLPKLLWLHNVSFIIWINAWYIVAQIVITTFGEISLAGLFQRFLLFQMLMMVCIITGNAISVSDYVTFRWKFWQYVSAGFVFVSVYSLASLFFKIIWTLTESYLIYLVILGILYFSWYIQLRSEKEMKFVRYL